MARARAAGDLRAALGRVSHVPRVRRVAVGRERLLRGVEALARHVQIGRVDVARRAGRGLLVGAARGDELGGRCDGGAAGGEGGDGEDEGNVGKVGHGVTGGFAGLHRLVVEGTQRFRLVDRLLRFAPGAGLAAEREGQVRIPLRPRQHVAGALVVAVGHERLGVRNLLLSQLQVELCVGRGGDADGLGALFGRHGVGHRLYGRGKACAASGGARERQNRCSSSHRELLPGGGGPSCKFVSSHRGACQYGDSKGRGG